MLQIEQLSTNLDWWNKSDQSYKETIKKMDMTSFLVSFAVTEYNIVCRKSNQFAVDSWGATEIDFKSVRNSGKETN